MRSLGLGVAVVFVAACGRAPATRPAPSAPASCRLLAPGSAPPDTVVIGVTDSVDLDHAPFPATDAERLVFRSLYQTLVTTDCHDRVQPELAAQWTVGDRGRRYEFTIPPDARFADGIPVTGADVMAAWGSAQLVAADSFATPTLRTLDVFLSRADSDALRHFADPALAVVRGAMGDSAPVGTAGYRVVQWTPRRIVAAPQGSGPVLAFRIAPHADARDLLDQGADVVVTDDPAAVDYATRHGGYDIVPLPWAWTYVFIGPAPVQGGDLGRFDEQLARGSVHGDVRAAQPPYWWRGVPLCPSAVSVVTSHTAARRVVYPAPDRIARDLASRLVALAAAGSAFDGKTLRAVAMTGGDFDASLLAQTEFGYVTALPRQLAAACFPLPGNAITPLVDARAHIIVRHGTVGVDVDADGQPRLVLR